MTAIVSPLLTDPPTRPVLRLVEPLAEDTDFADTEASGYIERDVDAWFASLPGEVS